MEKYDAFFEKFEESHKGYKNYLTDSTYFDLEDFYANETGQPFDEDDGYPEDVRNFASYVWDKYINPGPSILSAFKKEIGDGVIYLLINVSDKWPTYQIAPTYVERCLTIGLTNGEEEPNIFHIQMGEGFNQNNYLITSLENKDQITLVLVPIQMLIGAESEMVVTNENQ